VIIAETILLVSYTSLLTCWLLLTALAQLPHPRRLLRLAKPRLIPRWNFFSNPLEDNFYLLYRCRRLDGSLSPWAPVSCMKKRRRYFDWIWNPNGRVLYGMITAIQNLKLELGSAKVPIRLSIPYIALLSLVQEDGDPKNYHEVQFAAMSSSSLTNSDIRALVVSEFHTVPKKWANKSPGS
jgi:hypothetical protein